MRVIFLPTAWTVFLDILAWLAIHLVVVRVMLRIPRCRFDPDRPLYQVRGWERAGGLYNNLFHIKRWKPFLPDGAGWLKTGGFPKKKLAARDLPYLRTFAAETCRAELTHWTIILAAPLFFLWNKPVVGWIMVAYASIENLPLIMTQRYNRARIAGLLRKTARRSARR